MANVINKKTLEYYISVNTPDYPESEWIINPVLPKCESKYWKIQDDKVIEMTRTEKTGVDNAELEKQKLIERNIIIENKKNEIAEKQAIDELIAEGVLNSIGELI